MRVIAGTLKGRRLQTPSWPGLRPTSDKLRETLFNVIARRVPGARVLDGYAGTGALGIEAISRGARFVVFVDRDQRARRLIAENLAHCRIESGCAIIRPGFDELGHDQPDSLGPFHPRDPRDPIPQPFDIILLDPPYDDRVEPTLEKVAAVLAADGVLVLEHAKRREPPAAIDGLARVRQIASGDSALTLFERAAASRPSPD